MNAMIFVDGFNLSHALDTVEFNRFKWLNLRALGQNIVGANEHVTQVLYFTAYSTWDLNKRRRHQLYVQALADFGVQTIKGRFILVDETFNRHRNEIIAIEPQGYDDSHLPHVLQFKTYEEKQTDVNVAVKLLELCESYDHAYIVSADSDFVPAIQSVKRRFPNKKFTVVLPPGVEPVNPKGNKKYIVKACDECIQLTTEQLAAAQLSDELRLKNGKIVSRPSEWKV